VELIFIYIKTTMDLEGAQAEIKRLNAEAKTATETIATLTAENEELKALAEKNPNAALVVKGTAKVGGKTYRFKDGYTRTRNVTARPAVLIASEDALKDAKLMKHLVTIGYGGIEEVVK